MDVPLKNPRLIETKLDDGVELAWYPNCFRERINAVVAFSTMVLPGGYLFLPVISAGCRSNQDLAGFPDVVVAYEKLVIGLLSAWLLIVPLTACLLSVRIWFDARRRRSVVVRNGIVWFESGATSTTEKRPIQAPFALTDIARIVVLRVDGRRYPARMVECFAADGTRLLWRNRPVEIIDDLARKLSDLSGVPIEYEKPGERLKRAKR